MNNDDDFVAGFGGRRPMNPEEQEAGLAAARAAAMNMEAIEDYLSIPEVQKAIAESGAGSSVYLVTDEADIEKIEKAAAQASAEELKKATTLPTEEGQKTSPAAGAELNAATGAASADPTNATPGASSGTQPINPPDLSAAPGADSLAGSTKPAMVERPSELESVLGSIRMNGTRQQRLVFLGDPAIRDLAYQMMAQDKKLYYTGHTPMITLNEKGVQKYFERAAQELGGAVHHALSYSDRSGLFGLRPNTLNVFVAGSPEVVRDKVQEVQTYVDNLTNKVATQLGVKTEALKEGWPVPAAEAKDKTTSGSAAAEGSTPASSQTSAEAGAKRETEMVAVRVYQAGTDAKPNEPLKVPQTIQLDRNLNYLTMLTPALAQVSRYNAQRNEQRMARDDLHLKEDLEDAAGGKGGASKDGKDASKTDAKPGSAGYAEKVASEISDRFQNEPLSLGKKRDGQTHSERMLAQGTHLDTKELNTLAPEARQKLVVQLGVLGERVAAGEHGRNGNPMIPSEAGQATPRDYIDNRLQAELKNDPEFAKKAHDILVDMVNAKGVTVPHADALLQRIDRFAAEASQPTSGATVAATLAGSEKSASAELEQSAGPQAPQNPTAASEAPSPASTETTRATPEAVLPPAAAEAASPAPQKEVVKEAEKGTAGSAATASGATDSITVAIRGIVARPPEQTNSQAVTDLLTRLDAVQDRPWSQVSGTRGGESHNALAHLDGIMLRAEQGDFGKVAKTLASSMKQSMSDWRDESPANYMKAREPIREDNPAWFTKGNAAGATAQPVKEQTSAANASVPGQPTKAETPPPGVDLDAERRMGKTEAASGALVGLMSNPAGSFTHQNKTWNQENIQKAVEKVLDVDPDSFAKLSASAREKVGVAAMWLQARASDGRLPGFENGQQRDLVQKLTERVGALNMHLDDIKITPKTLEPADKADRMLTAMEERQRTQDAVRQEAKETAARGALGTVTAATRVHDAAVREPVLAQPQAGRQAGDPAAERMARDVVNQVFVVRKGLTPQQLRTTLSQAHRLTPRSLQGLDRQTLARTAVALRGMVGAAQMDGLGKDFEQLSIKAQQIVTAASKAVGELSAGLQGMGMGNELEKAQKDLLNPTAGAKSTMGSDNIKAAEISKGAEAGHLAKDSAQRPTAPQGNRSRELDR